MSASPHLAWLEGRLLPACDAKLSFMDQGLHYGLGVFEGIRAYAVPGGRSIFRLDDHLDRMAAGGALLGMDIDRDALAGGIADVLRANELGDAYIRPIAWLGDGQGLKLDVNAMRTRHAVAALPLATHLTAAAQARGMWLQTSTYRRNHRDSIPPMKLCGAYVNSVLSKRAAMLAGFDGSLFCDGELVCEATAENLFIIKDGELIAADHPDALPGITRKTLITLTGATSRPVTRAELFDADEVFLCGTSAEVLPVTRIDDRIWPAGAITRELAATYADLVRGRDTTRLDWLTIIEDQRLKGVA